MPASTIPPSVIRIVEPDANRRGDEFNRLAGALLHALGYEAVESNVGKPGRELDLFGKHRIDPNRYVCVESKATGSPIGGDLINKFVGVLDAERRRLQREHHIDGVSLSGYYVSLHGFRSSALEQERHLDNQRVQLIDGERLIEELVRARVVVSREHAIHRAARLLPKENDLEVHSADLLIHRIGWAWIVYYHRARQVTHFALIHVDGEPLAEPVANQIAQHNPSEGIDLAGLVYLSPVESVTKAATLADAREAYLTYLRAECGDLLLEGLPVTDEVSTRRVPLETLFVPLKVLEGEPKRRRLLAPGEVHEGIPLSEFDTESIEESYPTAFSAAHPRHGRRKEQRLSVGDLLTRCNRVVLLGPPGSGKSTLLRRIAMAYGFPGRKGASHDGLPDRNWFPLYIRCRDLRGNAREPVRAILSGLADRASLEPGFRNAFDELVGVALRTGIALLLVDGLDEIVDPSDRIAFAAALRTFLITYGSLPAVITSREAGFRVVAGALAPVLPQYTLADFSDEDIVSLASRWYTEFYGDNLDSRSLASRVVHAITVNDEIRELAGSPLLLTTLLLLQRYVGHLPTRRTALYEEAIKVLLRTWNSEAHEPIDQDEALPRLDYVAYEMLKLGQQRITSMALKELLRSAKAELAEELSYSRLTDGQFIDCLESRTSLLILTGYELHDGRLIAVYEFRHLTFQEYFAARAIAFRHYLGRNEDESVSGSLGPFLSQDNWFNVVPMAAVLLGRECKAVLGELVAQAAESGPYYGPDDFDPNVLLADCLIDEVAITGAPLDAALKAVALSSIGEFVPDRIRRLTASKFGERFYSVLLSTLESCAPDQFYQVAHNLSYAVAHRSEWYVDHNWYRTTVDWAAVRETFKRAGALLESASSLDKVCGALLLCRASVVPSGVTAEQWWPESIGPLLAPLLASDHNYVRYVAALTIEHMLEAGWAPSNAGEIEGSLIRAWLREPPATESEHASFGALAQSAIAKVPIVPLADIEPLLPDATLVVPRALEMLQQGLERLEGIRGGHAVHWGINVDTVLVLSHYYGQPLDRGRLLQAIRDRSRAYLRDEVMRRQVGQLLANLGDDGVVAAHELGV